MASKFYEREGVTVETIDPYHAASLEAQGFKEVEAPKGSAADEKSEGVKPLGKRNVDELRAHAAEHGIDLGDATTKKDILAAIKAAEAPKGDEKPAEADDLIGDADDKSDGDDGEDDPL